MKAEYRWMVLSCLMVGFLVASLLGCAPAAPKEKVFQYADINAFSGPAAPWGWMLQHSLNIAAEDINAAGGIKVGGEAYMVEVPMYDHAYDPSVAVTVMRKAIYDDGIKYASVLGGGVIPSINDLVQSEKVCIFGAAGGISWIGPKYPFTFKTYWDLSDSLDVILEYALKKYPNYKRIAMTYPDDDVGRDEAKFTPQIAKAHGLEVVDIIFSARATTDFYPALTGLLAKGVDIIEVGGTPELQHGLIIKQARELGFKGLFVRSDGFTPEVVAETCGLDALEGHLGGPQFVEMPNDIGKRWAQRYVERYGSLQSWTVYHYDGMFLLKAAIEKANSFDTEKVVPILETVSIEGALGEVSYKGKEVYGLNRLFVLPVPVVEMVNGKQVQVYSAIASRWR